MIIFCYSHGRHYDDKSVCQECVKEFASSNDIAGFISRSIHNITKTYHDELVDGGLNDGSNLSNGLSSGITRDEERELES